MKKILTIAILIIIVAVGGTIWYSRARNPRTYEPKNLITSVDRKLKPEDRARIETKLADTINQIGGDRDVADLELWIELGNYRGILGDLASASEAYATATDLNPLSYIAWANLASVRDEMNDLRGAEDAYRKAIDLAPVAAFYVKYADFLRARFPERKSDYEALLKIAVVRFGQLPEFIGTLAQFYEAEGRYDDALSHYRVLLPENPGVQRDIERVEERMRQTNIQ